MLCIELDAYTGCKIAALDIGSPVVRMAYSPTVGHSVIAILEVSTQTFRIYFYFCQEFIDCYEQGTIRIKTKVKYGIWPDC